MKTYFRSHELHINTQPDGQEIVYDVFQRGQHVLAGFSRTDLNETTVLERLRERVNQFINEAPSSFSKWTTKLHGKVQSCLQTGGWVVEWLKTSASKKGNVPIKMDTAVGSNPTLS